MAIAESFDASVIGAGYGGATDDGLLRARAIVSNAGIQPTVLRLAGREHFPGDYIARIGSLEPSGAIAGCRGAGTHQAVDSGFNVSAMVDADLG